MDLLPYERSTALWHRAAYLQRRLEQLVAAAPADALDPAARGRGRSSWSGPSAPAPAPRSAGWRRARRSAPRRRSTRCSSRTAEQAVFDLAAEGLGPWVALGDDPVSERWRAEFLYSRAATIYGGSAEIQRNIIARRLLDLGADR